MQDMCIVQCEFMWLSGGPGSPVFRIRIQLNQDPAKNLNPDPEDPESGS